MSDQKGVFSLVDQIPEKATVKKTSFLAKKT
jgi:hypothetical protein